MGDDLILSLTIPIPCDPPRARGIYSTYKYGRSVHCRMLEVEYQEIKREAEHIGVSTSAFIRWCAVQAARELRHVRTDPGKRRKG